MLYRQVVDTGPKQRTSVFNRSIAAAIIISIFFSIIATEEAIQAKYGDHLIRLDWIIAILFCIEYCIRLWVSPLDGRYGKGIRGIVNYVLSPLAMIDVIAILPTFLGIISPELYTLRVFRLVRIGKIGRSRRFKEGLYYFNQAIKSKTQELQISATYTLMLVLLSSTFMYLTESKVQPELFGSIPRCIWWAIMTVTTVGYGDAIPVTGLGKVIASATALMGIGVIAIPVGILAAGFSESFRKKKIENEQTVQQQDLVDSAGQ